MRGSIYSLRSSHGDMIETYHTTYGDKQNPDRVIEISTWSGCPCHCRFCMAGALPRSRRLSANEMIDQVRYIIENNDRDLTWDNIRRINYTRMGEPFLNISNVKAAIAWFQDKMPRVRHYISTIGVQGSDFSFITGNIALQISLHSTNEVRRNKLIIFPKKMSIPELGRVRTPGSYQKITLNMTLLSPDDVDVDYLAAHFDPDHFFVKFTPLNENPKTRSNKLGSGVVHEKQKGALP